MAKPPAYQWYPGDFRRDTGLQACTFYAQSVWRTMLDLMHDGEPYGHFTAGGVPITPEQFARMIGEPRGRVRDAFEQLEQRNVFSRTEAGVIYSRRMVRDEDIRQKRAAGGPKSLRHPNVPKPKAERTDERISLPPSLPESLPPSNGGSPAVCSLQSASAGTDEQKTDKQQPPLIPPEGEPQTKRKSKPKRQLTALPDDWAPVPDAYGLASQLGLDCLTEASRFRDHATATDRRLKDWDAGFRMWLSKAKEFRGNRPPAGSEATKHHSEYPGRGRNGSSTPRPVSDVIAIGTLSPNGERRWSGARWEPV